MTRRSLISALPLVATPCLASLVPQQPKEVTTVLSSLLVNGGKPCYFTEYPNKWQDLYRLKAHKPKLGEIVKCGKYTLKYRGDKYVAAWEILDGLETPERVKAAKNGKLSCLQYTTSNIWHFEGKPVHGTMDWTQKER